MAVSVPKSGPPGFNNRYQLVPLIFLLLNGDEDVQQVCSEGRLERHAPPVLLKLWNRDLRM